MPRISAIPPQVLLAPTTADDPLLPVEEDPEPLTKTVEVQTVYRESEAQTVPYSPEYVLEDGADPEVLMLQGLTHANGLPAGLKELEMIEHARIKRDLENNMLPFTDEACFVVRKTMMETQELREFQLREAEVEAQRDLRLATLQRALNEREESAEFLASQRVEAIRQSRMDAREKTLQKIRKKRINVLRKLARKRNTVDPVLSNSAKRDVINDYFDRGSEVYAPQKRGGRNAAPDGSRFDTVGRTAPLNILSNVDDLESSIPRHFTAVKTKAPTFIATGGPGAEQVLMSKTAPLVGPGGGRAAVHRLTSAGHRSVRNTKKDVETMHTILTKKRLARTGEHTGVVTEDQSATGTGSGVQKTQADHPAEGTTENIQENGPATSPSHRPSLLSRKPKGRPRTPDFTTSHRSEDDNHALYSSLVLLQRLIRGRAVQNTMFEGRYRRAELISELRAADEYKQVLEESEEEQQEIEKAKWDETIEEVRTSTMDAVTGAVASNTLVLLTQEKEREEVLQQMQEIADAAKEERIKREIAEAGRRQREGVQGLTEYTTKKPEPEPEPAPEVDAGLAAAVTPMTLEFADIVISTAAEKVAADEVLSHIENYPSLVESFKNAKSSEEQEEICRDLIQALSTPRPDGRGIFSPEDTAVRAQHGSGDLPDASTWSNDTPGTAGFEESRAAKEDLFTSVLARLRGILE